MHKAKKMSRSINRKELDTKLRESFVRLKEKVDLIFKHIRLQHTCLEKADQFVRLVSKKKITPNNVDDIQFDFDKFCEIYEKTRRTSTISQTQVARSYFRDSLETWFNDYTTLISSVNLDYDQYDIIDNEKSRYEFNQPGGVANKKKGTEIQKIVTIPAKSNVDKHFICTINNCLMTFATRQQFLSHQNDCHQNKRDKVMVTKNPLIAPTIRLNHIDFQPDSESANNDSNNNSVLQNRKFLRNSFESNPFITSDQLQQQQQQQNNSSGEPDLSLSKPRSTIITYSRIQPVTPIVSSTIGVNSGQLTIFSDIGVSPKKRKRSQNTKSKTTARTPKRKKKVVRKKPVIPAKVLKPETPVRKNPGRRAKVDAEIIGSKVINISDDDDEDVEIVEFKINNSEVSYGNKDSQPKESVESTAIDQQQPESNQPNQQQQQTTTNQSQFVVESAAADGGQPTTTTTSTSTKTATAVAAATTAAVEEEAAAAAAAAANQPNPEIDSVSESSENFMLKGGLDHLLHCSLQEADDNSIDLPW